MDAASLISELEQFSQPKPAGVHYETELGIDLISSAQILGPDQNSNLQPPSLSQGPPLQGATDKSFDQHGHPILDGGSTESSVFAIPEDPAGGSALRTSNGAHALPNKGAGMGLSATLPDPLPARKRSRIGISGSNHTPRGRQPFHDPQKRLETGNTRKVGACVRCRLQRIRVRQIALESATLS